MVKTICQTNNISIDSVEVISKEILVGDINHTTVQIETNLIDFFL